MAEPSHSPYRSAWSARQRRWDTLQDTLFDVAIIGGGINGACTYHHLSQAG